MITQHLLIEAAEIIERSAEDLRQSHTVNGEWICFSKDELDAFESYQIERGLADRLRSATEPTEQTERARLIALIEKSFPADSAKHFTASIGTRLLQRARDDVAGWRNDPLDVLRRYAQLCATYLDQMARHAERNKQKGNRP